MTHTFALLIVVSAIGFVVRAVSWAGKQWPAEQYGPLPGLHPEQHLPMSRPTPLPLHIVHNGEAQPWTVNLAKLREACPRTQGVLR